MELEKIKKEVEEYYGQIEPSSIRVVNKLRNEPLFSFETLLQFAAMFYAEKIIDAKNQINFKR